MQKISDAYKNSMKSTLRERGYIMLSFGLINQEAQSNAEVADGDFAYYSNKDNIFTMRDDSQVYATLEEDFTRVDGSMLFLPRESATASYIDTGLVGGSLVSAGQFEVTFNLNILATDIKGLTILFGENYPTDFDVVTNTGQRIEFRDNDQSLFTTEEVLEGVTSLTLVVYTMKSPNSRLRIYYLWFGYSLTYDNDSVLDSSLEMYVSPICDDIPQIDFSVTLKNYDQYFNIDNPESAINYLETGQEMDIYYGYQLPDGTIEWVKGHHLYCSEWTADDYSATITCTDVFRQMDSQYYKGVYTAEGKSYYELAVEVLDDAELSDYYIEPRLKNLYTTNPLPRVTHKEALQLIANACRCSLTQTRDGIVWITSNFVPDATASSNGETDYSNVENILQNDNKDEYASLAANYTTADGTMYFLPRDGEYTLNTGYVSSEQSDGEGKFTTNPVITVKLEAAWAYYGITLVFGNALPSGIIIRTYNDGALVNEYTVTEQITKTLYIDYDFDTFDTMLIEFTGTAEPYNRIVLNTLTIDEITDFTMERMDMTSSPTATKVEQVKEVIVPYYTYQLGASEDTLVSGEVTVTAGEELTYYLSDPCCDFRATLDDEEAGVRITASGSYYVTLTFEQAGTYTLKLFGYKYTVVEQQASMTLNNRGTTVTWENPTLSSKELAQELAEWLGEYYSNTIEYEYTTRGHPWLDANDIIYQENEYYEGMKVRIHQITLDFDQAFSGSVVARRTTY